MSIVSNERHIATGVLVIGGGMAGMFAAIKAREQGFDVTLTDKAYVGKAGSTHFAEGDILFFRSWKGHEVKEWLDIISKSSEYINNREWDEICLTEAEDRYKDLISWGIQFYQKDGKDYVFSGIGVNPPTVYEDITMQARKYSPTIRRIALQRGVRILDNIMICELLKKDEEIIGAIGFHIRSGNLFVIQAKAVVIATGTSAFKTETFPVNFWTGDGEAMAYRAGAEITGQEFVYGSRPSDRESLKQREKRPGGKGIQGDIIENSYRYPYAIGGGFTGWYNMPSLNAEGDPVYPSYWEAHTGHAPLYLDFDRFLVKGKGGSFNWMEYYFKRIELAGIQANKIHMDIFRGGKAEWPAARVFLFHVMAGAGIWPVDTRCASRVPGLYAAGNTLGSQASGAGYGGMGFGMNHAMVTGTRAGLAAAEYASKRHFVSLKEAEIKAVKETVCAPLMRTGGFSPSWVTQVIQSVSVPYFYLLMKHEKRLQAALTIVEFINNQLVPKVMAQNAHEWRLAQETRNMSLNLEMRLRASLFRTESRGSHFREDHPRREDPEWLAWVKVREEDGQMALSKVHVPEKWWPDLSKPYEARYPNILPME